MKAVATVRERMDLSLIMKSVGGNNRYGEMSGIYICPTRRVAVATDGQIMAISAKAYRYFFKRGKRGKIWKVGPLVSNEKPVFEQLDNGKSFPDFDNVVSGLCGSPAKVKWDIPIWLRKLDIAQRIVPAPQITIDPDGYIFMGSHDSGPTLNLQYVAPMAGANVDIYIDEGMGSSPVLFLPRDTVYEKPGDVYEAEWAMIVMPMMR